METSINGIGVVGGFGCGKNDLLECLKNGVTPDPLASDFFPVYIADTSYLETVVPKRSLRRIDHFSQLALTGAYLAINDAGLDSLDKHTTGLIICSGYGSARTTFSFLDSIIDYGDACASPTLFSNSVHNAAAGHISIMLGLEGTCSTVSQFEMSVPSGLLSAIQWLKEDRAEQVLFGAVDETCDVLKYCYQRYFGKNDVNTMTPLVPDKQSAVPGEGAVFFLLSKGKLKDKYYGSIESVKVGSIFNSDIDFPEASFFIVNADGHRDYDKHYNDLLPEGSLVSCFTPIYGSIPVGTAFDIAVAAISLREKMIFPSPQSVGNPNGIQIIKEQRAIDESSIFCIKIGRQDELGIIKISTLK